MIQIDFISLLKLIIKPVAYFSTTGRAALFVGNMQGDDSDEVSTVEATSIQYLFIFLLK